jgi:hypothetical protein
MFRRLTAIFSITDLYRPLRVQEVEPPRISKQSAHKSGKDVSPTHRPPLPTPPPQERSLVLISVIGLFIFGKFVDPCIRRYTGYGTSY